MAKQVMTLRVSPEDKARYEKAAKDARMSLGEWIRRTLEMKCNAFMLDKIPPFEPMDLSKAIEGEWRKPVGKIAKMMEKKP